MGQGQFRRRRGPRTARSCNYLIGRDIHYRARPADPGHFPEFAQLAGPTASS